MENASLEYRIMFKHLHMGPLLLKDVHLRLVHLRLVRTDAIAKVSTPGRHFLLLRDSCCFTAYPLPQKATKHSNPALHHFYLQPRRLVNHLMITSCPSGIKDYEQSTCIFSPTPLPPHPIIPIMLIIPHHPDHPHHHMFHHVIFV